MKVKEGYILTCKKSVETYGGGIMFKAGHLYKIIRILDNYMALPGKCIFVAIDHRCDMEFHETRLEEFFETPRQIRRNKLQKLNGCS